QLGNQWHQNICEVHCVFLFLYELFMGLPEWACCSSWKEVAQGLNECVHAILQRLEVHAFIELFQRLFGSTGEPEQFAGGDGIHEGPVQLFNAKRIESDFVPKRLRCRKI